MGPRGNTVSVGQNFDKFTSEVQVIGEVKVYRDDAINELIGAKAAMVT